MSRETRVPSRVIDEAFASLRDVADRRGVCPEALVSSLQRPEETFLTVSEVASILAVDRRTVGRYRESGELEGVDMNPSQSGRAQWRISRASLDSFLGRMRKTRTRKKDPIRSPVILDRIAAAEAAQRRANIKRNRTRKPNKHLV